MSLSRRELLLAGGGIICARAVGCGSDPIVLPKEIPAGNASEVPLNQLKVISSAPVCIARDSGGVYAMSLVCTHEGCSIPGNGGPVTLTLIHCGCHGSEYDGHGSVRLGPSTRALDHLSVTNDGTGALTIHGDTVVPATDRLTGV